MDLRFFIKNFIASLILLPALDFVWLGLVMKDYNTRALSDIAYVSDGTLSPLKVPTLLTYIVMAIALTAFAAPKIIEGTWLTSLAWGALLGFGIYGTFDMTNLALLKSYTTEFAMIDMAWGAVAFGLVNTLLFFFRNF